MGDFFFQSGSYFSFLAFSILTSSVFAFRHGLGGVLKPQPGDVMTQVGFKSVLAVAQRPASPIRIPLLLREPFAAAGVAPCPGIAVWPSPSRSLAGGQSTVVRVGSDASRNRWKPQ